MLNKEPKVRVGIMTAPMIEARFLGGDNAMFELPGVTIGKKFHWERQQTQRFGGELEIMRHPDGTLTAINIIGTEEYLKSVIGSEMSAQSPIELLKAHAVISRSWLMAQIRRDLRHNGTPVSDAENRRKEEGVIIDWQDREDHRAGSGQPGQSLEPTAFFRIIHYSLNSGALEQERSQLRVLVTGTGLAQPGDLDCN